MNVAKAIQRRRSIRRFQTKPVPEDALEAMVEAARLAPSAGNLQPCEYIVVNDAAMCGKLFPHLKWAAYIEPDGTPPEGNRPPAYVVVAVNGKVVPHGERDVGAAVQNILLTAVEQGLGGCWVASVNADAIAKLLHVPSHFRVDSVVALGYSAEAPVIETAKESVHYWKDPRGVLHVPKRKLSSVLHWNRFKEKTSKQK